jgi:glutathione synthase/RimK-type ligase-like ATP-grasp enzyme
MILLATNKRDITVDLIVLELQRRRASYFRLNTEDAAAMTWIIPDGDPKRLSVEHRGRSVSLAEVTGAYYRRPQAPAARGDLEEGVAEYVSAEWAALLRSLWNALEGRWLNSPYAIQRAEDKPRQLAIARARGLTVPETLITNEYRAASTFAAAGATVGKPLRRGLIEDPDGPGRVMFTSRIEIGTEAQGAIEQAPVIFQREIPKRSDIRVTVVDDNVFAASILSQEHYDTEVDWRRGARLDIKHEVFALPHEIAEACVAVTRDLGLRFAAIDLIEDAGGAFWFLEANPNGQWGWIQMRTGQPIASAIVGALLG